jgi:hypothetical protein
LYQASIHSIIASASCSRLVPVVLVEELELQGAEEALDHTVVVGVADAAHRTQQAQRRADGGRTPRTCIGDL